MPYLTGSPRLTEIPSWKSLFPDYDPTYSKKENLRTVCYFLKDFTTKKYKKDITAEVTISSFGKAVNAVTVVKEVTKTR